LDVSLDDEGLACAAVTVLFRFPGNTAIEVTAASRCWGEFALSILDAFPCRPLRLTEGNSARGVECAPILIEVLSMGQSPAGEWLLGFHNQLAEKPDCFVFAAGVDPFLAAGTGERGTHCVYVAALLAEDGRLFAMDAALTYVDLSEDERHAVRAAAGFESGSGWR
jgi:hypothetical protein